MKFKTLFTQIDTEDYRKWISFYPHRNKGTGFNFTYENNGYFDPRPQINTNLTTLISLILPFISLYLLPITFVLWFYSWGSIYINLPFDTGKNNTAESKTYGLTFYHPDSGFPNEFWMRGFKGSFYFPWHYNFWKRDYLLKSGWYTEQKGDDLYPSDEKWNNKILFETYPYEYTLNSGEKQITTATIYQVKMYWRRWFKLQTMCSHRIEVEFKDEVGERAGSWKGGTIGCSYEMKKGEAPKECLDRMMIERRFR